jgi:thiamine-phosphate pyrophosphorylase
LDKRILRIIDANLNRLTEGIRVCEEIMRFILEEKGLTYQFKRLRYKIKDTIDSSSISRERLLEMRDTPKDIGKISLSPELKRRNWKDIFFANITRIKESVRVLEEFSKLLDKTTASKFKKIRYDIYRIEKEAVKKVLSLCNL